MSLLSKLRERQACHVATAIPAISATQPNGEAATVARIATIAVANPKQGQTAALLTLRPQDLPEPENDTRHYRWRIHYADREPEIMTFTPEETLAGVFAWRPDAVAAEPVIKDYAVMELVRPMTPTERATIKAGLDHDGVGPEEQDEIMAICQTCMGSRNDFIRQAVEIPSPIQANTKGTQ